MCVRQGSHWAALVELWFNMVGLRFKLKQKRHLKNVCFVHCQFNNDKFCILYMVICHELNHLNSITNQCHLLFNCYPSIITNRVPYVNRYLSPFMNRTYENITTNQQENKQTTTVFLVLSFEILCFDLLAMTQSLTLQNVCFLNNILR